MKRLWITPLLALALTMVSGCTESQEEAPPLTLQVALVGEVQSLDPIYATDVPSQTLLANLYDNLMVQSVNSDGVVEVSAGLAKTVDTTENTDGTTTYTFTLRRAYWSDGEAITAGDFEYAWKRLANPASNSPYGSLLSMVAGYEEMMTSGNVSALQVSAVDDDVLKVVITGETDWFLQEVCTAMATLPLRQDVVSSLKETVPEGDSWASDFTALVTCGSYTITDADDDGLTLTTFESHYATPAVAEEIQVLFTSDINTAWEWYESQSVSFVWPVLDDIYTQLLDSELYYAVGSLFDMTYVAINNQDEILQDSLVRQALSNAVDYSAITQTFGVTTQIAQGIVPAGIAEAGQESFRQTNSVIDTDPDTYAKRQSAAQIALAQSTYPWDVPDYALELLYVDQGDNQTVAFALCQQWTTTLGITLSPVAVETWELTQAMTDGTYQLALTHLNPQVNDSEPYLSPWVSTSVHNTLGYANSAYDTLLTIAATAAETSGRMGCLHDAEALLLEDFALIPLYSSQTGWLLSEDLTGITRDSRGWFYFDTITQRSL